MKNKISKFSTSIINYFVISTAALSINIILPGVAETIENPPIKDNNPCIEELCINDEVKSLVNLKWKKVTVSNGDYTSSLKAVGDPNAVKVFSRYWSIGRIDSIGLQALSKIKGFCQKPMELASLQGEYTNKKGQPVMVSFVAVPSEDGKSQKFIVTDIFKMILKEKVTEVQYEDLAAQAKARYQSYYYDYPKTARYPNVSIINNSMRGVTLHITSQFGKMIPGGVIDPSKFQYFPGCGGDKKINL
jgi:hypothetical protein